MDLTQVTNFVVLHKWEIGGICTLGFSLWIAFGPLRRRLPRIFIRIGKYSATFKLLFLSGVCWVMLYRFLTDDIPSALLNWGVGLLGAVLLAAAIWVFTRKHDHDVPALSTPSPKPDKPVDSKSPTLSPRRSSEPQAGV